MIQASQIDLASAQSTVTSFTSHNLRLWQLLEFFAEHLGAEDVALGGGEFLLRGDLEVGGLNFDEDGVEEFAVFDGEEAEIGTHAEHAELGEGFLALENVGVAQDGVGAADVVADLRWIVLEELEPGVAFVRDDFLDDLFQSGDQHGFMLTERVLVGNLKEVRQGFAAFSVESTDGQADFLHGGDDLIHGFTQNHARQMEHGGGSHAGAQIGRAGGEVAEFGIEGEGDLFGEFVVHPIQCCERLTEVQPGADALHAEVVLLIDHDGNRLLPTDHGGAPGTFGGLFPADEVLFHENQLFDLVQVCHVLGEGILHFGQGLDFRLKVRQNFGAFLLFCPSGKRFANDIARQTNPAGDDDVAMRPVGLHPIGSFAEESGKFHRCGGGKPRTGLGQRLRPAGFRREFWLLLRIVHRTRRDSALR